jgi:rhamnogalacturonan endolyase
VKLNGTVKATWKPGYKDASVYRSAVNSGRHYLYTVDFPCTELLIGTNLITFQTSNTGGKNGILYDCIKLEAGSLVTSGVEDIRESAAVTTPRPYKHIVNGHLVIEKSGRRYSLTGALQK